jgi:hypothetical protein
MLAHNTERKLAPAKSRFGLAAVSRVRQLMILLSPILLPVVALLWLHSVGKMLLEQRTLKRFASKHRDPEHIPVNVLHLNRQTQRWFKLQTPEFFALGFHMIGDFQYRTQPFLIVSRHFMSDDGQIVGSLITMNGSRCAIEMSSIDSDEVYVGTCTVGQETMGNPMSTNRIAINHVPLQHLAGVVEEHRNYLADRGSNSMCFDQKQVKAMLQFGSRCMSEWKYRQGLLNEQPPDPVLPAPLETCHE